MSSIERFISTKAYEWKRKQVRIQNKKERLGTDGVYQKIQGINKKPQVIGFIVGEGEANPRQRQSKKRAYAKKQAKLKKILGIALIMVGLMLAFTQCFGNTKEDEGSVTEIQTVSAKHAMTLSSENINQASYQEYLRNFTHDKTKIENLFNQSTENLQHYAHTFSVWALQEYYGEKNIKELRPLILFGVYEDTLDFFKQFIDDFKYFPIDKGYDYIYENGWKQKRTYGGDREHYGIDIMSRTTEEIPIISMSDGIVEQIGWNRLGGYRVGVRSLGGAYFYYAHMKEEPSHLQKGDFVKAGECLGIMGDTGYGEEGTRGKFPVHLHIGIAVVTRGNEELWINPYGILRFLEDNVACNVI